MPGRQEIFKPKLLEGITRGAGKAGSPAGRTSGEVSVVH
jgi:hypothetical protein